MPNVTEYIFTEKSTGEFTDRIVVREREENGITISTSKYASTDVAVISILARIAEDYGLIKGFPEFKKMKPKRLTAHDHLVELRKCYEREGFKQVIVWAEIQDKDTNILTRKVVTPDSPEPQFPHIGKQIDESFKTQKGLPDQTFVGGHDTPDHIKTEIGSGTIRMGIESFDLAFEADIDNGKIDRDTLVLIVDGQKFTKYKPAQPDPVQDLKDVVQLFKHHLSKDTFFRAGWIESIGQEIISVMKEEQLKKSETRGIVSGDRYLALVDVGLRKFFEIFAPNKKHTGLTWEEAQIVMTVKGEKVKLPEWTGYWYFDINDKKIKVLTGDGEILDTPHEHFKQRKDWMITDGSLGFDWALRAMKNGKEVKCKNWDHKYAKLRVAHEHIQGITTGDHWFVFDFTTNQNYFLRTDWMLAENHPA